MWTVARFRTSSARLGGALGQRGLVAADRRSANTRARVDIDAPLPSEGVSRHVREDEMDNSRIASAAEWHAARMDLLAREKEATHAKDAVDAARRELPMTEVTKDYAFTGPDGRKSLDDLFEGRRQLITYHCRWDTSPMLSDLLVPGRQHRRCVPPA